MSRRSETDTPTSHGVERLIERLREEGVAQGRAEADAILAGAQRRAREIVAEAEAQGRKIREEARRDAESFRKAGEEALHLAVRDAILKLRDTLINRFGDEVKALVAKSMSTDAVMIQLIREVAKKALGDAGADEAPAIRVQLPGYIKDLEQLRKNPEELREGSLSHFVLSVAADLLEQGIVLESAPGVHGGIVVRLEDNDIAVDLGEEAVAKVLLEHMAPRFRALLEGIIR